MKVEAKKLVTLRDLRKSTGLTQNEFGKLIGLQGRQVHLYEMDSRKIPHTTLLKYIKGFNVSYEDIYLGVVPEAKGNEEQAREVREQFIKNLKELDDNEWICNGKRIN